MPMDRGSQRSQASNEKLEPDNKIIINKLKKKKKNSVKLLQYVNTPWPTENFFKEQFYLFIRKK